MKIYILKVDDNLQPSAQPFNYPAYNDDYGVEQDFLVYLSEHNNLLTENINDADWHYLPVFWTRWHLNHEYGKKGLKELSTLLKSVATDSRNTFTVCQYDDGPILKIPNLRLYLSSRKRNEGFDIPLLSKPHKLPWVLPRKKYLASFVGRLSTHKIRKEMAYKLSELEDVHIVDGDIGVKGYVNSILESYVSLCPRGYGGSSFRFFESMQLGVVPLLIGDIDTRPFKKDLMWDSFSFYARNTDQAIKILKSKSKLELIEMGKIAHKVWDSDIKYGRWENNVIKDLFRNIPQNE